MYLQLFVIACICICSRNVCDAADCGVPTAYTEAEGQEFVDLHNEERRKYGADMYALSWDENLAARAQEWADQCTWDHDMMTDCSGDSVGQNGYQGPSSDPADVMASWISESANWDFSTQSCKEGEECGHWTQVVWSSTMLVGCGYATCSENKYVFCDYSPPGNMEGEKPYIDGESCTACAAHSRTYKCVDQLCVECDPAQDAECVTCDPATDPYCQECEDAASQSECDYYKSLNLCDNQLYESFVKEKCFKTCGFC